MRSSERQQHVIAAEDADIHGVAAGRQGEMDTALCLIRMHDKSELKSLSAPADGQQETDFLSWLANLSEESSEPANNTGAGDGLDRELWAETERKLVWAYPYAGLINIPAKVSVTEIKRRFEAESDPVRLPKIKKPLFLQEKKGLSAAEIGTVMHFVMQHLDLRQSDIERQIKEMVERDLLTGQQARVSHRIKYGVSSILCWAEGCYRQSGYTGKYLSTWRLTAGRFIKRWKVIAAAMKRSSCKGLSIVILKNPTGWFWSIIRPTYPGKRPGGNRCQVPDPNKLLCPGLGNAYGQEGQGKISLLFSNGELLRI